MVQSAAKAPEVEQPFAGPVERNTIAVEQVDDGRTHGGHLLDGRLVGQEIAAENGVVEVLANIVALALQVLGGVDAALGANRVRALNRDDGEKINLAAGFGDLDNGRKAGEASADDDDTRCCCCCHGILTFDQSTETVNLLHSSR